MNATAVLTRRRFAPARALAFARGALAEQGASAAGAWSAARALALLLERSRPGEPVFLSGNEGASLCGFDPRTWWLAKKRLLELGHLVASSGGEPPSGRPGGRGRKAAYFVSPETLERFRTETLMASDETLNETLMDSVMASVFPASGKEELSDHRSLRTTNYEKTLDVLRVLEGRGDEEPVQSFSPSENTENGTRTCESAPGNSESRSRKTMPEKEVVLAQNSEKFGSKNCESRARSGEIARLIARESKTRVRLELVRVLGQTLVLEALERASDREVRTGLLAALALSVKKTKGRKEPGRKKQRGEHEGREQGALPPDPHQGTSPLDPLHGVQRVEPSGGVRGSAPAASPSPSRAPKRARAAKPLWSPEDGREAKEVFLRVRAVLEWANGEFGASFPVERSSRDALRYPYEVVRGALANVLLKKKKGYPFENPGAVLWDGITLSSYRLEEFAVASLDEVLRICEAGEGAIDCTPRREERRGSAPDPARGTPSLVAPVERVQGTSSPGAKPPLLDDRRRVEALRAVYEALSEERRADFDRRSQALAREGFAARGLAFEEQLLSLRALSRRNELLESECAGEVAARLSAS